MKNILAWARHNLIVVICAAVVLVSVVLLFVGHSMGASTAEEARKKVSDIRTYEGWARFPVPLPSVEGSGQAEQATVNPNPQNLEVIKAYYAEVTAQVGTIQQEVEEHNIFAVTAAPRYSDAARSRGHALMLEGLFPRFSGGGAPWDAQSAYRQAFEEMLGPYHRSAVYPTLSAGMPPSKEAIDEAIRTEERRLTSARGGVAPQDELATMKRNLRMSLYLDAAQRIHIYASQPQREAAAMDRGAEPAFDIGAWSRLGSTVGPTFGAPGAAAAATLAPPTIEEVWRGQMNLWIQQDIAEAIARMNQVDNPAMNVTLVPVKRLKSIRVEGRYVGIEPGDGTFLSIGRGDGRPGGQGVRGMPMPMPMPMGPMGGPGMMGMQPSEGMGESARPTLGKAFAASPTGRISNDLYDVWHAVVTVDIDSRQIPLFLATLAEVNFIAPLKVEVRAVDEYDVLQEGFVYGSGDVVELTVYLETLWLRSWTEPWMPEEVKRKLGLVVDQPVESERGWNN